MVLTRDISRCRLITVNNIDCITSLEQTDEINSYWDVINLDGEPNLLRISAGARNKKNNL